MPKISSQESVEGVKTCPRERIFERMREQMEIIEVPKISSQEQILQRTVQQILEEYEALPNRMILSKSWTPCSIRMQCSRMSLTAACVKWSTTRKCWRRSGLIWRFSWEIVWDQGTVGSCLDTSVCAKVAEVVRTKLSLFYTLTLFSVECVFMRGEAFLLSRLRGRCCTQSTDVVALVWSLVLHASRRHCLEALYKTQDKLEMRQMDVTKDMRTTKHVLEENWQEELALIEQSRNALLPEKHENKQKMSRSTEFGGHVGTEQETSEQSQRKEARVEIEKIARWNVGARAEDSTRSPERGGVGLGGQSIATRRTSQRHQRIAVYDWVLSQFNHSWAICYKGNRAGMTAAFTGPNVNPLRFSACSTSQRQRRQCTKCQALGSMTFAAVICGANEPCSSNIAWEPGSFLQCHVGVQLVFFLYFWKFGFPLRILEMTDVHHWR